MPLDKGAWNHKMHPGAGHAEINCLYGIPFEFPCLGILHQRIFAGGLILCNHIVVAMPTLGVIARRINQQAHPAVGCFKRCERLHGLYIEIIEVRILSNLRTDYIVGLTLQSLGGLHRFGSIDAILFVITEFHSLGIPLREIALQCYRKGLCGYGDFVHTTVFAHVRHQLQVIVIPYRRVGARLKVAREFRAVHVDEIALPDFCRSPGAHIAILRGTVDNEPLGNPFVELCHHDHRRANPQSLIPLLLEIKPARGVLTHAVFINSGLLAAVITLADLCGGMLCHTHRNLLVHLTGHQRLRVIFIRPSRFLRVIFQP